MSTTTPDKQATIKAPINPWISLMLLAAVQLMVVLDMAITNVAMPTIGRDLQMDEGALTWVVNAYALLFGGFLMLGGRMGDLLGRRRVFMVGLVLFSLASLLGGLSTNDWQIISARALQGLGGALLAPSVLSITASLFKEGADRNKAMGVIGAIAGSGGALGSLLGGVLTDSVGWEWVFFVNVPIGLIALALTPIMLRESRDHTLLRHFDVPGAILVTGGVGSFVYGLMDTTTSGWGATQIAYIVGGALMLAAFILVENRSKQPLVRLGIFKLKSLTGANVVGVAVAAAMFSMFFFLAFYMQQVLGLSALETGLRYLPLAGMIIVSAGIGSGLVTKLGVRPVMIAGLLITAVGMLWLTGISVDGSFKVDLLGPTMLTGFGMGWVFVPMMIAAVAGVREEENGLASGLINTTQQVGGAVGLAVLYYIFAQKRDDIMGAAPPPAADPLTGAGAPPDMTLVNEAMTAGIQDAFVGIAALALAALVLAWWLVHPNLEEDIENAAPENETSTV